MPRFILQSLLPIFRDKERLLWKIPLSAINVQGHLESEMQFS